MTVGRVTSSPSRWAQRSATINARRCRAIVAGELTWPRRSVTNAVSVDVVSSASFVGRRSRSNTLKVASYVVAVLGFSPDMTSRSYRSRNSSQVTREDFW